MYVDDSFADAALDLAAPVEPAATSLQRRRAQRVVASSAAQQLAAVRRRRIVCAPAGPPDAAAPVRPERPGLGVRLAVVGRRGHVQQVVLGRAPRRRPPASTSRPAAAVTRGRDADEPGAGPVECCLDGSVVLGAQAVADVAERGQLVPAGAHAARSRHAVALARRPRQLLHRLDHHTRRQYHLSTVYVTQTTSPTHSSASIGSELRREYGSRRPCSCTRPLMELRRRTRVNWFV